MRKQDFQNRQWYSMAVALCIGVLFYYLLNHLGVVGKVFRSIGYYIYPLVAGAILAYLINPLMRLFEQRIFARIAGDRKRRVLALTVSLLIVLVFVLFLIGMLVPQLTQSVLTLYNNKDAYISTLSEWLSGLGAGSIASHFEGLFSTSQSLLSTFSEFISSNGDGLTKSISAVGGHLAAWGIGIIFSIYFLSGKDTISASASRLLQLAIKDDRLRGQVLVHLKKIDFILTRYLMFSIIDGLIVGAVNAIFMAVMGMQYMGLISVIVGVTNLIPTFGPLIGGAVGGLILLLVNPMHALYFLIFTMILQTIDGYVLKPKMFGETFGVSGLWILIAIIIGGRIFGVVGILLAIPTVAIIDYLIKNVFVPLWETMRAHDEPGVIADTVIPDDSQDPV